MFFGIGFVGMITGSIATYFLKGNKKSNIKGRLKIIGKD
ncbi:hypothetical protein SOJ_26840 [Staphylococcus sp. OJ82]|nr:hypothetical protein SOJ_26840 [Staphylococcus sp. OJ82]